MKCEIAKMNPLIIHHAFKHYTSGNKGIFTFKSLYSDEEPYSLAELITCISTHAQILEVEQQECYNDSRQTELWLMMKKLKQLNQIQQGAKR